MTTQPALFTQQISPRSLVERAQRVMAHAWMVRTFIKHGEEIEDFPELMGIVRGVFDTSRALETRVDDPAAYFHMLQKKIGKLRAAADQFAIDAANASTHTNFQQAVLSMQTCVDDLQQLLETATRVLSEPPQRPASDGDPGRDRAEPDE